MATLPKYGSYANTAVTFPKYAPNAGGTSTGDLAQADRKAIAYLFNPNPDFNEVDTAAAEQAVASGTPGSGFARNNQLRLRDSEIINRAQIGHQMLDPYLAREQQTNLQSADNAARLQQIAAQGEEARKQLELQNSGQMALQSAEARARLEQIAAQGSQAMEQLRISEAGDTARLNTSIRGNLDLANLNNASALERAVVGGAFDLASRYGAGGGASSGDGRTRYGTGPGTSGLYPGALGSGATKDWVAIGNPANIGTSMRGFPGPGPAPVNPPPVPNRSVGITSSPLAQSATQTVDRILQQYGLS